MLRLESAIDSSACVHCSAICLCNSCGAASSAPATASSESGECLSVTSPTVVFPTVMGAVGDR